MKKYPLPQLRKGEKILVAFSGGVDSRVLLELLLDHQKEWELELALFYFDHALRPSSAEEALFAIQVGEHKNLPVFTERHDVKDYCQKRSVGIEEGARDLRYERLRKKKESLGFDTIAVGHHLDDNVETFFLNLLRGSGLQGLRGMEVRTGDLYRPLLSMRKKELEMIVEQRRVSFVTDESNFEGEYTRNKLRLDILPRIEEDISPALYRTMERTMALIRREDQLLSLLTEEADKKLERPWKLSELLSLDEAILYRLLRKIIEECRGSTRDVSAHDIDRVVGTIRSGRGITEIQGYHFLASQGKLYFMGSKPEHSVGYHPLSLGRNDLLGMSLFLEETDTPEYGDDVLSIPEDMVSGSLYVRTRRLGDRFSPSGMKGSKKLKDFLMDEKVPLPERDNILLVCDEERIYWVVGYRKAQIPKKSSGKYLVLHQLEVVPKEDNS